MKSYNVVCAVVINDGRVLCMRRPWRGSASTAGKWEFPGGKIEEGEHPEEALLRELLEEMDYEVTITGHLGTVQHQYPDFALSLQAFVCEAATRRFNRKEHIDHVWLAPGELHTLDWAMADKALIPLVEKLPL